jgi:hypothetical protein
MRILSSLLLAMVVLLSGVGWAQTAPPLSDLARREAERRKAVKKPTKVYTNADVKKGVPLTTAAETPAAKPAAQAPAAAPGAEKPAGTAEETRDEAWWRKRMTDLRDQLNRNRLITEALQSRINALYADFTARDDPAQRAVIERNRDEALAELERVKTETARQEQAIADAEEEARKANVPPGWLR